MDALEFEEFYANQHDMTAQELRDLGRVVVICDCGADICQGFASMAWDQAESYINSMPGMYGYAWPTSPWPKESDA